VRLKGHRLVEGAYEPQSVVESMDGTFILRSETLGLELRVWGEEMFFLDPATGCRLLGHQEEAAARRAAEAHAEAAEIRLVALEVLARLKGMA